MGKSRNNISSLLTQLSKSGSGGRTSSLLSARSAIRQSSSLGSSQLSLSLPDTRKLGLSDDRRSATGINFGKAPVTPEPASTGSSKQLLKLLTQTAEDGLGSALGGNFGLGTFGGIGSIISAIGSLFGGHKKALPPLVQFSLPKSQNQTKYVNTTQHSAISTGGKAVLPGAPAGGIYGSSSQANMTTPADEWAQTHSAQIAQAVKTALLNSSSLNDVIAEI